MAGAVVVVEAVRPQRRARQGVERRAGGAGREAHPGQGQVALQHQGEALAHLRRRLADGHGAGDVGGAVQVLGAGIDQQQRAGSVALVQPLRSGGSGRWRRWRPAPAMVSKDRSFSAPVASRKPSSLATDLDLVGQAGLAPRWPASAGSGSARRRRGRGRGGSPSISTAFLQARGRAQGSAPRTTSAPAPARVSKYQAEDWAGSTSTRLALQLGQRAGQVVGRLQPHLVAEPGRQVGRHLGRIEEQPRRAVGVQDRLAQRQGRADDVAAADVEQPGDRGRRGDHRGLGARRRPGSRRPGRAWRRSPRRRYSSGCGTTGARRLRRARLRPRPVQRVGGDGLQLRRRPWPRRAFSRSSASGLCRRGS